MKFLTRRPNVLRARFWVGLARHARRNVLSLITLAAFGTSTFGSPVFATEDCGCLGTGTGPVCGVAHPADASSDGATSKGSAGCCGKGAGCRCSLQSRKAGTCCCSRKASKSPADNASASKRPCCAKRAQERDAVNPVITDCTCGGAPKSMISANSTPKLLTHSVSVLGDVAASYLCFADFKPHSLTSHQPPTPPPEFPSA